MLNRRSDIGYVVHLEYNFYELVISISKLSKYRRSGILEELGKNREQYYLMRHLAESTIGKEFNIIFKYEQPDYINRT